jgi:hypothetical protein
LSLLFFDFAIRSFFTPRSSQAITQAESNNSIR